MKFAIAFAAILCLTTVNGQTECQCGAFIVNDATGYSEWFHTFRLLFGDTCANLEKCQQDCYALGSFETNDGDLTKNMPGLNITFGDYACGSLDHDVAPGARVAIEYQLCASPWIDTGLATTQPFCCINREFPEGRC